MPNASHPHQASPHLGTHDVINQSPVFEDIDLFTTDRALVEAAEREGAGAFKASLERVGKLAGSPHVLNLGRLANEHTPQLKRYDQKGRRLDRVEYHPAYHHMMALSFAEGLHSAGWEHLAKDGAPVPGTKVARGARLYMISQAEAGHICPVTMTHACIPALRLNEELLRSLLPQLLKREYDGSDRPMGDKSSLTIGMGMTEKQGGTDVRANSTRAEPLNGGEYVITGHKWFMSAPMCDAFLILAQAPKGLSCFFLPRLAPDGAVNGLSIERLKDKLGNRSNASSEVEFRGARAQLVGEEGRGVPAIIEMVMATRLDCALASAGLMRFMLANALRHAKHRTVFQKKIIDHALMAQVLVDLALDAEAATALAFRLAGSFDREHADHAEHGFRRLMTPVIKYWVCKSAPAFAYEALECMGGNGYVEEGPMARAYREAPLNAIWEGSGNVMCLDILRVLAKEPDALPATLSFIEPVAHGDALMGTALDELKTLLSKASELESGSRHLAERLAVLMAAALLTAHTPGAIADAFIASRLAGRARQTYGAGLHGADTRAILERAGGML